MRFTLDTNILVSAFIAKHGHPANLLELALTVDSIELVLSEPILNELEDVLTRDEVKNRFSYTNRDIKRIVRTLEEAARIVPVKSKFTVVREDSKDDMVLNAALDGKADYIVSGDRHLLKLDSFRGIKIVKPRRMMRIISEMFPELVLRL